jgi:hypothetical protein
MNPELTASAKRRDPTKMDKKPRDSECQYDTELFDLGSEAADERPLRETRDAIGNHQAQDDRAYYRRVEGPDVLRQNLALVVGDPSGGGNQEQKRHQDAARSERRELRKRNSG